MRWRYPRFRIKQRRDGWHIWWIPACDPIRRIHVADTFEEAVAHNRHPHLHERTKLGA